MKGSAVFEKGMNSQGTIDSLNADFAEWFEVAQGEDAIKACDVVRIVGEKITLHTDGRDLSAS